MKKIAAILFGVLMLTACHEIPTLSNQGFTKARGPQVTAPVTVANPSSMTGFNVIESLHEWNNAAGRKILDAYPVNDAYGLANADIRFAPLTICAFGDCNDRRAYWVNPTLNADRSVQYCTIYYDPHVLAHGWYGVSPAEAKHPDTLSHEIGHCLGWIGGAYIDAFNEHYRGVMSYYAFYAGQNAWYQQHDNWWDGTDVEMLRVAGYRVT